MEVRISSAIGFLIILGVLAPAVWFGYKMWTGLIESYGDYHNTIYDQIKTKETKADISQAEKDKIDNWIAANDLNQYGDPQNTLYAGGTPLFNEDTGEKIDRYQYIINNHSDRPWNNS